MADNDDEWPSILDLWPAQINGPAFLSTFTFDAPFFEMRLLPELLRRKAHPIVVLVDRHEGYASALRSLPLLDGAGRDYHVIPIDVAHLGGCFHAKVHAFPAAKRVLVGSGNLTPGGSGRNLEAVDVLEGHEDAPATASAFRFLARILGLAEAGLNADDRQELVAMLPAEPPAPWGTARFLDTLDGPLGPPVLEVLGGLPTDDALLVAPFHDEDHYTSMSLLGGIEPRRARIVAEAATPWTGQASVEGSVVAEERRARRKGEAASRPLHAKVIVARGELHAAVVVGSANLTRAAWQAHNVEAVVVRVLSDPRGFEAFEQAIRVEGDDWWAPPARSEEEDDRAPLIPVRWARLEGNALSFGAPHLPGLGCVLASGGNRHRVVVTEIEGGYSATIEASAARCLVVWLSAQGYRDTGVIVAQPALLATTGRAGRIRRMFQRIEAGLAEDADRREVMACLVDVLSALHRGGGGRRPVTWSAETDGETPKRSGSFHGDSDEAILEAVDDLPFHARGQPAEGRNAIARLAHLVDLLVRPRSSDAERAEDVNERTRAADATTSPAKRAADNEREWLASEVARLVDHELTHIRATASDELDRASIIYVTVRRLLDRAMKDWKGAGSTLAVKQLAWMASCWAVADWPRPQQGWAIDHGLEPDAAAWRAVTAAWDALHPSARGDETRDLAHRIVVGLDRAAAAAPVEPLLDDLRAHVTRGERAAALVEPLWALELGWLARTSEGGRQRFEAAHERAKVLPDPWLRAKSVYALWRQTGDRNGRRVRRMPTSDACPACHRALPRDLWNLGRDPSRVIRCSCGILLAHGGPEEHGHG